MLALRTRRLLRVTHLDDHSMASRSRRAIASSMFGATSSNVATSRHDTTRHEARLLQCDSCLCRFARCHTRRCCHHPCARPPRSTDIYINSLEHWHWQHCQTQQPQQQQQPVGVVAAVKCDTCTPTQPNRCRLACLTQYFNAAADAAHF